MAITDIKMRRSEEGTIYVVRVNGPNVEIKDGQAIPDFKVAFALPAGAKNQVAFEVWPSGMLEVVYIGSDGMPYSKWSLDGGRTFK